MSRRLALTLALTLLVLFACSRGEDSRNSSSAQPASPPAQPAGPSLDAALADLDAYIPKKMAQWKIPGAACAVVKDGAVVFAKGYGVKKAGGNEAVDADTVFQVGSTSKAFTAAQMAQLVEEGRLAWTDPVRRHFPGFAMHDPWVSENFLVADLMAQRSGLPEHAGDMMILLGYTPEEYLRALRFFKPATSFRSAFAYQNGLFLAAGEIIRAKTGRPWAENVAERIFKPLGMTSASATLAGFEASANRARPHFGTPEGPAPIPDDWPLRGWAYTMGPAGGINSSVNDMAKWVACMAGGGSLGQTRILKPESLAFLHAPSIHSPLPLKRTLGFTSSYCQGWVSTGYQAGPVVWHTGGTSGMSCVVAFLPSRNLGLVWLTNLGDNPFTYPVPFHFFDTYLGLQGPDLEAYVEDKARATRQAAETHGLNCRPKEFPALGLPAYAGTYANEALGNCEVVEAGGSLRLLTGAARMSTELRPCGRDSFEMLIGMPGPGPLVQFLPGPDGHVQAMRLEVFEIEGVDLLQRVQPPNK